MLQYSLLADLVEDLVVDQLKENFYEYFSKITKNL